MNYKLQIKNQFLKIITDKSVTDFLEDNGIKATEGKTLSGQFQTIVRYSTFTKTNIIKKVELLLKEVQDV